MASQYEVQGRARRGSLYDLPGAGRRLAQTRDFFDRMQPDEEDSTMVTVGKNVVRYGAVAATGACAAGVAAVVCL